MEPLTTPIALTVASSSVYPLRTHDRPAGSPKRAA
jgi:hypothetical protein